MIVFADYKFSMYTPSMISAASVAAALHGLDWTSKHNMTLPDLLDTLQRILSIETVSHCHYTCRHIS